MALGEKNGTPLDLVRTADGKLLAHIGFGWDAASELGGLNLDASVIMLGANDMPRTPKDLYFYNHCYEGHDFGNFDYDLQKKSPIIFKEYWGGDFEDDEAVLIDFSKIPADIEKLVVILTIYDADKKGACFKHVSNAYVRVCTYMDEGTWLYSGDGKQILRFDLSEEESRVNAIALLLCEIVRNGDEWRFHKLAEPVGDGSDFNGLIPVAKKCGLV